MHSVQGHPTNGTPGACAPGTAHFGPLRDDCVWLPLLSCRSQWNEMDIPQHTITMMDGISSPFYLLFTSRGTIMTPMLSSHVLVNKAIVCCNLSRHSKCSFPPDKHECYIYVYRYNVVSKQATKSDMIRRFLLHCFHSKSRQACFVVDCKVKTIEKSFLLELLIPCPGMLQYI